MTSTLKMKLAKYEEVMKLQNHYQKRVFYVNPLVFYLRQVIKRLKNTCHYIEHDIKLFLNAHRRGHRIDNHWGLKRFHDASNLAHI